jgi:hypothetical protein
LENVIGSDAEKDIHNCYLSAPFDCNDRIGSLPHTDKEHLIVRLDMVMHDNLALGNLPCTENGCANI